MYVVIAIAFLLIAGSSFYIALRYTSIFTAFCATLGLFSIGYYALPLLLPELTPLKNIPESDINAVASMSLLYMICLLSGFAIATQRAKKISGLRLPQIDKIVETHWWIVTVLSAGVYFYYIFSTELTSYAAEDFVGSFKNRSPLLAIISFFSSVALSAMALNLAVAIRLRKLLRIATMLILFIIIETRLLAGAQRLLFITPIFMIFVSLLAMRQYRVAGSTLVAGVIALLIISPFAVALREARAGINNRHVTTATVSYREGYVMTTLQSIADRSDLIYNMTYLKRHVDSRGYARPTFYKSVFLIPVPRMFLTNKPYLLSDNGRPDGEASILAWRIMKGNNVGSLTAFGSIIAYRAGGWPAVMLDGFAAGIMFAYCLGFFSRGGYVGKIFLSIAFVSFAVSKVPMSFFEGLAHLLTYAPLILALYLLQMMLIVLTRQRQPVHQRSIGR